MDLLANYLCTKGYAVMCPDLPGHILGASTRPLTCFAEAKQAVIECAEYAKQHWNLPVVLAGHSLGGAASLCAAAELNWVAGVCAIAIGIDAGRGFSGPIGQAMRENRQRYLQGCDAEQILQQVSQAMHAFRGIGDRPTTLVAAKGDVIMTEQEIRELAAQCTPPADVQTVNATHLTAPDACKALLLRFLQRCGH